MPSAVCPSAGCSSSSRSGDPPEPSAGARAPGATGSPPSASGRRSSHVVLLVERAAARAGRRPARRPGAPRWSRRSRATPPGTRGGRGGGPSRACVASRPETGKPACSSTPAQGLELVRVDRRVDHEPLIARAHGRARRLPEAADRRRSRRGGRRARAHRGGGRGPTRRRAASPPRAGSRPRRPASSGGLERLLVAVDPDHRDLALQARLDVVVVAGGDVDPALLAADPPLALGEVRRDRACRSEPAARSRPGRSRAGCGGASGRAACRRCSRSGRPCASWRPSASDGVGLLERRPALHRVGQEARPGTAPAASPDVLAIWTAVRRRTSA